MFLFPSCFAYSKEREAAALGAAQVAFVLQGRHRGLQFAIASGPQMTSRQDTV